MILTNETLKKLAKRPVSMINEIILHCSDTDNEKVDIERIDEWHRARGFACVGYHYFIDTDGKVHAGRPLEYCGAHCKGHNGPSVGVCLNGKKQFFEDQESSLMILIHQIEAKVGSALPVNGHNRYDNKKTCPNFCVDYFMATRFIIPYKRLQEPIAFTEVENG